MAIPVFSTISDINIGRGIQRILDDIEKYRRTTSQFMSALVLSRKPTWLTPFCSILTIGLTSGRKKQLPLIKLSARTIISKSCLQKKTNKIKKLAISLRAFSYQFSNRLYRGNNCLIPSRMKSSMFETWSLSRKANFPSKKLVFPASKLNDFCFSKFVKYSCKGK